ncbi:hypothetical protein NLJ89_g4985 [Agrocybe chaxingu]|uniref:Uncharacterized protein n=1 Tax=Agrocybe chaxingu TaxID=84603 RepID=A0A9W8K1H7_9AGAR|nr:hypothetical protein NLJ89_g4985 [Agrocybe chaxingu]
MPGANLSTILDHSTVTTLRYQLQDFGINPEDIATIEDPSVMRMVHRLVERILHESSERRRIERQLEATQNYAPSTPPVGYDQRLMNMSNALFGRRHPTPPGLSPTDGGPPSSQSSERSFSCPPSAMATRPIRMVSRESPIPSPTSTAPSTSMTFAHCGESERWQDRQPGASDRPHKRKRKEGEPVEAQLPEPLPAHERGVEGSSRFGEGRLAALIRAIDRVNRRLDGMLPEDDPNPVTANLTGYTGDSDDESDDSHHETFLDFNQHYTGPPADRIEMPAERQRRENLNRHQWKKIHANYCRALERTLQSSTTASGSTLIAGRVERSNHLFNVGKLWAPVIYLRNSNTVLAGNTAQRYTEQLANHEGCGPPRVPPNTAVYRAAPRGYPMSPAEIDLLVTLARNVAGTLETRMEAHILLTSFYRATTRIDSRHHDAAMRHILNTEAFDPQYHPEFMTGVNDHPLPPIATPTQRGRPTASGSGYGLPMPTTPFDVLAQSQYLVVHQMLGTSNAINGVIVDYAGRVYLPSMFTYSLTRLLGPISRQARAAWVVTFAYIVARPYLYAERIVQHNTANPATPFVEASGPQFTFVQSTLSDSASRNVTEDDVVADLIRNGIPVSWIDQAYAFGLRLLDQTMSNFGRYQEVARIDSERMQRLRRFGVPPTLPPWSGWWSPSIDDIRRIRYFFFTNPAGYDLNNPFWIPFGGNPVPTMLISRLGEEIPPFIVPAWNPDAPPLPSLSSPSPGSNVDPSSSRSGEAAVSEDAEMMDANAPPSKPPPHDDGNHTTAPST